MQYHAAHRASLCWFITGRAHWLAWMVSYLFATSFGFAAEDAPSPLDASAPLAASDGEQTVDPLSTADQPVAAKRQIHQLIRQLGDPHFASRRSAAAELRQIGAEAFDQLHEATADPDPEIAASARYLLRRISVRWVQSSDSPTVRNSLRDYDRQPDNVRLRRVDDLSELANGEGVAGLCRIARFDRSPIVSRMAALAVIRPDEEADSPSRIDPSVVERELGGSSRVAAEWLRR
jgi:hypothetical protein